MAHQDDLKIRMRAYYECNSLSYPKVTKHFEDLGYEISVKTVQAWGGAEGWEKNKYADMSTAVEKLLPPEVLNNVTDAMKQTIIDGIANEGGVVDAEVIEAEAEAVSRELIYKILSKENILGQMANNLQKAGLIASSSTSMGVKATYHGMLVSAKDAVYGKKVVMTPSDPNNLVSKDEDFEEMSKEQLLEIYEGI